MQITQSFIKAFQEYLNGQECGLILKAKYVDGIDFPSTDAQNLGQWFEYICTGAKTKHGRIPEPEYLKDGKTLAAKYRLMESHKATFERILAAYQIKILEVGKTLSYEGYEGTIDIIAEMLGEKVFIDLKTTAHINNKWEDYGWDIDTLDTKEKLMVQAVHYKLLGWKIYGNEGLAAFVFTFNPIKVFLGE